LTVLAARYGENGAFFFLYLGDYITDTFFCQEFFEIFSKIRSDDRKRTAVEYNVIEPERSADTGKAVAYWKLRLEMSGFDHGKPLFGGVL
jgi:hypothetical protein